MITVFSYVSHNLKAWLLFCSFVFRSKTNGYRTVLIYYNKTDDYGTFLMFFISELMLTILFLCISWQTKCLRYFSYFLHNKMDEYNTLPYLANLAIISRTFKGLLETLTTSKSCQELNELDKTRQEPVKPRGSAPQMRAHERGWDERYARHIEA